MGVGILHANGMSHSGGAGSGGNGRVEGEEGLGGMAAGIGDELTGSGLGEGVVVEFSELFGVIDVLREEAWPVVEGREV